MTALLGDVIKNKDWHLLTPVTYHRFLEGLDYYLDYQHIEYEHEDAVFLSGRVKMFSVREWLCTDTYVGLYLYLIDDQPCCLVYQDGRKSSPEWNFLSKESLQQMREIFEEYKPEEVSKDDDFSSNEDLMMLVVSEDLKEYEITYPQMLLSNILYKKNTCNNIQEYFDQGNKNPGYARTWFEYLTKALEDHDEFMTMLEAEFNDEIVERAKSRSAETVELCKKTLEILEKEQRD